METDNNEKVLVFCWYCGKKFYIDNNNVHAGDLFCSNKCREDNERKEREEYMNKYYQKGGETK